MRAMRPDPIVRVVALGARESAIICLDNLSFRGVTGDGAGRQTYEER